MLTPLKHTPYCKQLLRPMGISLFPDAARRAQEADVRASRRRKAESESTTQTCFHFWRKSSSSAAQVNSGPLLPLSLRSPIPAHGRQL